MNYLDFEKIKPMINQGKTVEQFLGLDKSGEFPIVKWISLYFDKNEYCLDFHKVFDEREEYIDNIYDFSYVEPDDMYGKRIYQTKNFDSAIKWLISNFPISHDKFLPFDYLNEELEKQT